MLQLAFMVTAVGDYLTLRWDGSRNQMCFRKTLVTRKSRGRKITPHSIEHLPDKDLKIRIRTCTTPEYCQGLSSRVPVHV
jgi:hypothetical protein